MGHLFNDYAIELISNSSNAFIDFGSASVGNSADYNGRILYNFTDEQFKFYSAYNVEAMTLVSN